MSLATTLNGARFVRHDPDTCVVFAWFGGHGVNVYSDDGQELDHWNVGNLAQEAAEIGDVISSIDAWLAHMYGDRSSRPQSDLLRAAGLK
jgi:hypothetical protein